MPGTVLTSINRNRRSAATLRVVVALILREMSTRYGKSALGFFWALLEPLGGIILLGIGFSLMVRSPPIGSSFFLFYASGFLPFSVYQSIAGAVGQSLKFNRPLLVYPAVTWLDAVIARFLLNMLTGVMVTCVLISGILTFTETRANITIVPMLEAILLASFTGLSVGIVNCVLIGVWPAWAQIWSIITRPLFLASGVIFMFEDLSPTAQSLLWWNPLMHISGLMREGLYPSYQAHYVSMSYVAGLSLLGICFGMIFLRRYHRKILNQ